MKLHIQNMVSLRCKMMVKSELAKLGIAYNSIELGEVQLTKPLTDELRQILKKELHKFLISLCTV